MTTLNPPTPPFGVGYSLLTLTIEPHNTEPQLTPGLPYKGSRALPKELAAPTQAAIYRLLIPQSDAAAPPEVYIGKTTSMRRRVLDYLEMTRRLRAHHRSHPVRDDKHNYRYVHYALARASEEGRPVEVNYYVPAVDADWKLDRIELLELSHHVVWSVAAPCYDFHLLNSLPSFKRFTGPIANSAWQRTKDQLPRPKARNAA